MKNLKFIFSIFIFISLNAEDETLISQEYFEKNIIISSNYIAEKTISYISSKYKIIDENETDTIALAIRNRENSQKDRRIHYNGICNILLSIETITEVDPSILNISIYIVFKKSKRINNFNKDYILKKIDRQKISPFLIEIKIRNLDSSQAPLVHLSNKIDMIESQIQEYKAKDTQLKQKSHVFTPVDYDKYVNKVNNLKKLIVNQFQKDFAIIKL